MTLEDPFFVVKEEVSRALNKTRGLYSRWTDLQNVVAEGGKVVETPTPTLARGLLKLNTREELEWTSTELRNALRSIEWDLEDLEDTIWIIEKNPNSFKVGNKELTIRRNFIEQTRAEVKIMKDKMNISKGRDRDRTARQPIIENSPTRVPAINHGTTKYSKLENEIDSPNRQFLNDAICNQSSMMRQHDGHLDVTSDNIGSLRTVSQQINSEFDEQQVMLDDFSNKMEVETDSKLDATMKKMAKVLHMSNDRSKLIAIGVLTAILLVLVTLCTRY
ncbi:PREDICTED: syntaxin-6 isoform X2 [Ceratosolen solmsi marchali]|uniref:Syntaxin-6 isoform X2 n=1 Tax=Ceratosolen solmsi marchali TaxID=326594 RepID=A0AAJ6VMS4_9HYME|nr:PREDICTED: syntaxin-6 isoform X2 [Ceratosolen solmsi marchali]